jgi:ADP-ribose pyrophosphatase YjhB (NUDIX family)
MEKGKTIAAGILPVCTTTGRILLIRRGFNQPEPGTWACFGGKFESEDDINMKDNATREFVEESGYKGKFRISNKPLDIYENNHLKFYTFVGIFEEEFVPNLEDEEEAIDYGWFYFGESPEDLHPGVEDLFKEKKKTIQNIICFFHVK